MAMTFELDHVECTQNHKLNTMFEDIVNLSQKIKRSRVFVQRHKFQSSNVCNK